MRWNPSIAGQVALAFALTAATPLAALAQDFTDLSLDDLIAAEVTSVAKRPQRVGEAPTAIFVITQDDIRRSGLTSIPELLRMAPGMEVAELASGGAAVTARGFNGRFSNKLLVLIDGRAIYLSTLGGVLWDQQLVPVEDIERIEIVRGPGATMWGANAVNGVINIVTRHGVDTLGPTLTARTDASGNHRLYARMGAPVGEAGTLRVFVSDLAREHQVIGPVATGENISEGREAGFRFDWEPAPTDAYTLQGNVQAGSFRLPGAVVLAAEDMTGDYSGANLLGRWAHSWSPESRTTVQVYADHVARTESGLDGRRNLFDLDLAHFTKASPRHSIVIGGGYRYSGDHVDGLVYTLNPPEQTEHWAGAYIEDEFSVIPDRLLISAGVKVGHNSNTGSEFQPSIRGIWLDPKGWAAWAAVSRAQRTPSRLETSLSLTSPMYAIAPSPSLGSEVMVAYEAGWRGRIGRSTALDLTAYHQTYKELVTWNTSVAFGPFGPQYSFQLKNQGKADVTGAEAAVEIQPTQRWWLKLAASWQDISIDPAEPQLISIGNAIDPGMSPTTQLSIRSNWEISDKVDVGLWLRHVSSLKTGPVPAYTDLTAHIAWRPVNDWEVSLTGSGLLDRDRIEIIDPSWPAAIVERKVMLGIAYKR